MTGVRAIKGGNLGPADIAGHKESDRKESAAHPSDISPSSLFLRCTFSHQHTKQSPPPAASAALSCTASMVKSTWKEKHHVVPLDARFIQLLTCTQESWKMFSGRCSGPKSSSTLVARDRNSWEVRLTDCFLVCPQTYEANVFMHTMSHTNIRQIMKANLICCS